jgi:hypothetical protein
MTLGYSMTIPEINAVLSLHVRPVDDCIISHMHPTVSGPSWTSCQLHWCPPGLFDRTCLGSSNLQEPIYLSGKGANDREIGPVDSMSKFKSATFAWVRGSEAGNLTAFTTILIIYQATKS